VDVVAFRAVLAVSRALHTVISRYAQAMVNQISQSVVCNHLHSVEQRMCRWLLMTHDRVNTDAFLLTQEFLAQMLGVRRPTVTVIAGKLQRARLIRYHRGTMEIIDRQGLEESACVCYRIVRRESDRLLNRRSSRPT
jgi:CRP-like cAMP-binding protein